MITADEAEAIVGAHIEVTKRAPCLIAIDGLPLSGKSTLAERLIAKFDLGLLPIDDFCAPAGGWPRMKPAFPFPHFRNNEFVSAVEALVRDGACRYHAIDWPSLSVSNQETVVTLDRPVIVEGVSVAQASLADLYALRFWVESDRASLYDAMLARDGDKLAAYWRDLFLPSVDLYLETSPRMRADHIVAGRGALNQR